MLDSRSILTFVRVVKDGSFSRAASSLNSSPSAVSRAISRLERELGVKLFHRTTRSLSLTAEGREFERGARTLLQDWEELEARVSGRSSTPAGLVKLSLPSAVGREFLVDYLVDFRQKFPDIDLEVSFQDRMVNLAEQGFDLVVRTGDLAESANHIATKFFDFEVLLCASPAYLANSRPIHTFADLRDHTCLRFRNTATGRIFSWWVESKGIEVPTSIVFDDGPAIARACELGAGLAMLPTWHSARLLRQGSLVEVLPQQRRPFTTPAWLVYLNRQVLPARSKGLLDYLLGRRTELQALLSLPEG